MTEPTWADGAQQLGMVARLGEGHPDFKPLLPCGKLDREKA